MKTVLFDGYFGMANAGDDAFCVVADLLARERGLQARYVARPSELPHPLSPEAALLPSASRLPGATRLRKAIAVARTDALIHFGGSTLRRMNRHRRDQLLALRWTRTPAAAIGVSVGPFRSSRDAADIRAFLSRFALAAVRDQASVERCRELGLTVVPGADPAYLLPPLPATAPRPDQLVLGVAPCGSESRSGGDPELERRRQQNLEAAIRAVVERTGCAVRLIALNRHPHWGDVGLVGDLAARLAGVAETEVVVHSARLDDTRAAIAGCQALIAVRLHGAILAHGLGVPIATVAYHEKCSDFARDVGVPEALRFDAEGPRADAHEALAALLRDPGLACTKSGREMASVARAAAEQVFGALGL
jgi:polysaccharide pyruvyl transferase WcaK-like protein